MYTLKEHQSKKLISTVEKLTEDAALIVPTISESNKQILQESAKGSSGKKLIVQMEGIHVGRTANYTYYTESGLKNGLSSWTHPYNKPVLTHHNQHGGEPIGRILKAEYSENTKSGRGGLVFTVEITDPAAQEKVLDGRYQTVSIGASTNKVTCNICGTDRTKEWCEHWKGNDYDGQTCHFVVGDTLGEEVSYVNVPADENAGNISIQTMDDETQTEHVHTDEHDHEHQQESVVNTILQVSENHVHLASNPTVNLFESIDADMQQMLNGFAKKPTEQKKGGSISMKLNEFLQEKFGEVPEEEMQNKISEFIKSNESLKKDLTEAKAKVGEMAIEKSKIQESLEQSNKEKQKLIEEADELKAQLHKNLVEQVVNLKRSLKKPDVMDKTTEEAIEEHAKRSKESLENTLTDLLAESKSLHVDKGSVENPGQSHQEEGKDGKENKKRMTLEEGLSVLKSAFSHNK